MGDWKPQKEQTLDGTTGVEDSFFSHSFYLWIIPANAGK
jgi:hypothetical protein